MSDDVPIGALIGLLFILLLLSAFFSGTETALMSLNRYRLRHKVRNGHRGARLAEKLLARPDRLIGLILFGNNLVNFSAAALVSVVSLRLGGTPAVAIGTFIFTVIVLIFAEVMPKTWAALYPETLAFPASYLYYPLMKVAYPIVWLINLVANSLLSIFGVTSKGGADQKLSIEELRTLVEESRSILPQKRQKMLMGILELEKYTVDDIMVPQKDIIAVDLSDAWENVLKQIRGSQFTRLPVFRDSLDNNVLGILHMKRLVQSGSIDKLHPEDIEGLLDQPYFVPEGTPLNSQLVQFQRTHQRTALVVDEYGDIQGLVTLEDLLEEIVGEFTSEPVTTESEVTPDATGKGYVVDASANIREINRMMNWKLPTDGPKTINGLILEQLEKIPETGTGLMLDAYPIEILETSESAIKTVRVIPET
ncbi:MAG: Mg2+/Co2+ transporter CorB [Gammaproteobacteria bacterium]